MERMVGRKLDIGFKTEEFEINEKTIGKFQLLENRRMLRENHAKKIKRSLLAGKNFDAPLIVNLKKGKYRIIDGQHRITAVKSILDTLDLDFKIKCLLCVYENLTKQDECKIFDRYNQGMRQSGDDILQMFAEEIPILKYLEDAEIKVRIYNKKGYLHFKPLVEAYMCATKKLRYGSKVDVFMQKAKELTKEDADKIKEFIIFLNKYFNPFHNSDYAKTTPLTVLMHIFINTKLRKDQSWEVLSKKIMMSEKFMLICRMGGRTAVQVGIEEVEDIIDE